MKNVSDSDKGFFGRVTLVQREPTSNKSCNFLFGEVVGVSGDTFHISTRYGEGQFCRTTGRCLEAQWRNLENYEITVDHMDRFAAILKSLLDAPAEAVALPS